MHAVWSEALLRGAAAENLNFIWQLKQFGKKGDKMLQVLVKPKKAAALVARGGGWFAVLG